jgi:hypothetical protein
MISMDAREFSKLVRESLRAAHFERDGSAYHRRSDELIWVVEPERRRGEAKWSFRIGCLSRALAPGIESPHDNECHLTSDYVFFGDSVPGGAAGTRFDDHRSYFTMAFDLDHDLISDDERRAAVTFAAEDLAERMSAVKTIGDLCEFLRRKSLVNAFIHRALKELIQYS